MCCFRPEKKRSILNKGWNRFISMLQKKLESLETSKFHFNKTRQHHRQHHHHHRFHDCHFKLINHDQRQEDSYGFHTKNMVEPLFIETFHAEYLDMERKIKKAVFPTSDIGSDHEGCNEVEEDAAMMETEDDDTSFVLCETTQKHGVDEIAEEFINKMKGIWKHENQKSYDQDRTQSWKEHRVDAIAEEFIKKMRGSWKLEKQKSVEDYVQRWVRLHEY